MSWQTLIGFLGLFNYLSVSCRREKYMHKTTTHPGNGCGIQELFVKSSGDLCEDISANCYLSFPVICFWCSTGKKWNIIKSPPSACVSTLHRQNTDKKKFQEKKKSHLPQNATLITIPVITKAKSSIQKKNILRNSDVSGDNYFTTSHIRSLPFFVHPRDQNSSARICTPL